ncbi:hypothetical protein [Solicola sp. PLA-1-18]|uniref:hypothetical protein n=1 Tax=Solicola sp. PLA-1-18 TaxID=3380532 RepID=UPI003B7E0EB7
MSTRAYLAVTREHLRALRSDGVLRREGTVAFVAVSDDEEDEDDAASSAAAWAEDEHGEALVVAADLDDAEDPAEDVPLTRIASFLVGEDLAWYAAQELDLLL